MKKIRVKSYSDVCIGEYPFHKELKDELVPLLENYPDKQGRNSNVIATMTEWDWDPKNDRLDRLKDSILESSNYNCSFLSPDGKPVRYFMRDFWGNIYRKGDYTEPHTHRPEILSCVYFLKTEWYHSPLVFKSRWDEPVSKRIRPKEGTYVIFPSRLHHFVPKHRYRDTRITLSGNMRINES